MEIKNYYFHPGKASIKQGYLMEDENQEVVYEANVLKQPLLGAADVEFVNHISGKSETHKVGHTVTTETSGLFSLGAFSTKSHFKYDGEKIWDYLHARGVRLESGLASGRLGMVYDVTLKGEKVATVATSSRSGNSFITNRFTLDVATAPENIDLAFLVAYSIAKTEQTIYS